MYSIKKKKTLTKGPGSKTHLHAASRAIFIIVGSYVGDGEQQSLYSGVGGVVEVQEGGELVRDRVVSTNVCLWLMHDKAFPTSQS